MRESGINSSGYYVFWFVVSLLGSNGCSDCSPDKKTDCTNEMEQSRQLLSEYKALAESNTKKTKDYFARSESRVNLDTGLRRDRERKIRSMIRAVSDSELDCARTENNILFMIQQYSQKWVETFNYNPLDSNKRILDPVKSIWLVKNQANQFFSSAPESRVRMLQFNFGDDEGRIIEKLSLANLAELLDSTDTTSNGGIHD